MKPLQRGHIPPEERHRNVHAMFEQWKHGHTGLRKAFNAASPELDLSMISSCFNDADEIIWVNDKYQVNVTERENHVWLSIKRRDKQPIHDWRDLQEIKNQILGAECEAVEIYPAESRRVDSANQYHLWGSRDPKFRFPIGFTGGRFCTDDPIGNAVQRPFEKQSVA